MQKYKVVISNTAKCSILANHNFISKNLDNESAAFMHTMGIYKEIKKLEHMPNMHKIYEGKTNYKYHVAKIRQYLIFYRVDEGKKVVYVVDVLHSHRNLDELIIGN